MEIEKKWIEIAPLEDLADLKPGESVTVDIETDEGAEKSLLIVRGSLRWYVLDNLCSHDNGPLGDATIDIPGCTIQCARHGAKFALNSGEVVSMPAVTPIGSYEVKEENGFFFIRL